MSCAPIEWVFVALFVLIIAITIVFLVSMYHNFKALFQFVYEKEDERTMNEIRKDE